MFFFIHCNFFDSTSGSAANGSAADMPRGGALANSDMNLQVPQ